MIFRLIRKMMGSLPEVGTKNKETRDKWLEKELKMIKPGLKILDAGAGELRYKPLCSHLDYISQDFCQYDGKGDQVGLQCESWNTKKIDVVSDITEISLPDKSFDAIMCIEVFEHIPDLLGALKEFSRLLKPGGGLILTVPFCCLTHQAPYFFTTGFSKYYFLKWLKHFGFKDIEISYNGNYFEWLAQELRRIPFVADKYCGTKRFSRIERSAIFFVLKLLNKLSAADRGSNELLSFGLFIKSKKE